jgi:cytidylate kinase
MSDGSVPVIAIDGPGGSGKGTVAAAVARQLGWHLLDSGALYRLVGLAALDRRLDLGDAPAVAGVAATLDARFLPGPAGAGAVVLDGQDVTAAIRTEAAGQAASRVAAIPAVRAALVGRQHAFRRPPGLVADGRDMGAIIFPDARLKVFLTASVEERARRRHNQLKQKGIDVSLPALSKDMAERDRRDAERAVAPLRPCPDARLLDSTGLGIEDVVTRVLDWAIEAYPEVAHPGGPADSDRQPES